MKRKLTSILLTTSMILMSVVTRTCGRTVRELRYHGCWSVADPRSFVSSRDWY